MGRRSPFTSDLKIVISSLYVEYKYGILKWSSGLHWFNGTTTKVPFPVGMIIAEVTDSSSGGCREMENTPREGSTTMIYDKGLTTNELFLRTCGKFPEKVAMIDGARGFTYTALNREANRFGNAIRSLGMKKGDRVAFIVKDCKEFVFVYLRLAKIGAVRFLSTIDA